MQRGVLPLSTPCNPKVGNKQLLQLWPNAGIDLWFAEQPISVNWLRPTVVNYNNASSNYKYQCWAHCVFTTFAHIKYEGLNDGAYTVMWHNWFVASHIIIIYFFRRSFRSPAKTHPHSLFLFISVLIPGQKERRGPMIHYFFSKRKGQHCWMFSWKRR